MKGRKYASKRALVLSTSPRIGGNPEMLADVFIKGTKEAGHEAKEICLYDKKIEFCKGCLGYQTTEKCILRDDAERIIAQMKAMDILVFATPIYFYETSGQMKTLLDRINPLSPVEHEFRDIYLLAISTGEGESSTEAAMKGLEGQINYFGKSRLADTVRGTSADKKGAIEECGETLPATHEMGRNVQKEAGAISLVTTILVVAIALKQ